MPDWKPYNPTKLHTKNIRKFYELSYLGGEMFSKMKVQDKEINTPFLDMVSSQANQGYYLVKNIQSYRGSDQMYDLWLLAKDLSEEEAMHLHHFRR